MQLIREAEQSEDEVKASAELDRLERLIKHFVARTTMLLEVAQISSNKFLFKPSELNLSEVINGVVNDYMPMILRSGSELTTNIQNGVDARILMSSQFRESWKTYYPTRSNMASTNR